MAGTRALRFDNHVQILDKTVALLSTQAPKEITSTVTEFSL